MGPPDRVEGLGVDEASWCRCPPRPPAWSRGSVRDGDAFEDGLEDRRLQPVVGGHADRHQAAVGVERGVC